MLMRCLLVSLVVVVSVLPSPGAAEPPFKKLRIRFRQPVKVIHHYHTSRQYAKGYGYGKPVPSLHRPPVAKSSKGPKRRRRVKDRRKAYRRDRRYGLYNYASKYRNWVPRRRPYRPRPRKRPSQRRRPPHRYPKREYAVHESPDDYPDHQDEEENHPEFQEYPDHHVDDHQSNYHHYPDHLDDDHHSQLDHYEDHQHGDYHSSYNQYPDHLEDDYYDPSPGYSYNDVSNDHRGSNYGSIQDEFQQNYENNGGYYRRPEHEYNYEGEESGRREVVRNPQTNTRVPLFKPIPTTPTQNKNNRLRPNPNPPQQDAYIRAFRAFSYQQKRPQSTLSSNIARSHDVSKIQLTNPEPQPSSHGDHDIGYGVGLEEIHEGI